MNKGHVLHQMEVILQCLGHCLSLKTSHLIPWVLAANPQGGAESVTLRNTEY